MEIYEPQGRAREYSPLALNYLTGCTHGCEYCYVPNILGRYNSKYNHNECKVNVDFRKIELSAKKFQGTNKQILLSFTGDPYADIDSEVTRQVLTILNKYGHKVAILTKGTNVMNDLDIFKQFGDRIKVGFTLTFDNDTDSLKWEPGASTPAQRVEILRQLAASGIRTWASFEPVIIPEQSLHLLDMVSGFIDHVRIGKLNNYKGLDKNIDWTRFIDDAVTFCRKKNITFYIKKDLLAFRNGTFLSPEETDQDFLNL